MRRVAALWQALSARVAEALLTIGVYGLGLTLFWTSIGVHLVHERRQLIRYRVEEAGNLARGFEENVASAFTAVDQALIFMRSVYAWQHADFDLALWTRSSAFLNNQTMQMSFIDRDGKLLQSNLGRPEAGQAASRVSIADREHFRVQRDSTTDQLFISKPLLGRVSHKLSLNVTRKFFDDAGGFAGVAVVSFAPEFLNSFYNSLRIGHGRLTLAGTDGVIRARAPDMPQADPSVPLDPALLALAGSATANTSRVDDAGGRIVALRQVRGFPLMVVVELPIDEALAPYWRDQRDDTLAGLGITLLLTVIWLLLLRHRQGAQRSRRTLFSALQSISQGLLMVDAQRRVAVINNRAVELLELPAELARENGSFDALCDWQVNQEEFGKAAADNPDHENYLRARRFSLDAGVYERERRNGTALEIRTSVLPDGSAVRTFTDITERRRNEQMLRDARDAAEAGSRARTEFVAVMSHEIRTPLNGILGVATLLADCPLGTEERQHVEIIRESGEHLLDLVNDILDFSKLEAERVDVEWQPFALPALLGRVIGMLQPQARQKGLDLVLQVAPDTPEWVAGDQGHLRQILVNLLGNAIKFTASGRVALAVAPGDRGESDLALRFEVHDTGIGIAPAARDKLFKVFTQVDQSISRRFGGTGLGLAICQRLAALMGGTIGVESTPGLGSIFWLELRLKPAAAPPPVAEPSQTVARTGLRILLAEDNATNRLVATRLLTRRGHIVEAVPDGARAFAKLRVERYDLLLTDVMMPLMDGLELTRSVRQLPAPFGTIPIVGLTARSNEEGRRECLAAGMDDHVSKPIAPEQLERAIARAAAELPLPAATAAFDADRLHTLGEAIGADAIAEVIDLFRAQIGPQLALLRQLEADGDAPTLVREVHALAGSARTIGLERLGMAAKAWEQSLREPSGPPAGPQAEALAALAEEALHWLAEAVPRRAMAPT